ncbi:MAG TPA: DNA-binding transcriptional regulator [Isosphaeraceae bacterium]|nr:DNA-binding transcriptional regulator [Isosphaeraceae bacterium]
MVENRSRRRFALPHVALIVETSTAYGRAILSGISQYVREYGPWTVYIEQRSLQDPAPPWLERWAGDGIIARASTPQSARKLAKTGVPTVDLNDQVRGLGLPQIHSDHAAIARLAADHLIDRGFRHFAYFGFPIFEWSVRRQEAFTNHVLAAGHQFHEGLPGRRVHWSHQQASWEDEIEGVAQWVKRLPKPLGIMAGNDIRGIQMLDACRRAGVAVPEEVAVVGVDNEELVCLLAYPPLSSVVPDAYRVGYESAALLDQMMKGHPVTEMLRSIPPVSVATRQSSDVTAIANPCLASAMQFIRESACQGIGVDDVLAHLSVSRSVLQRLFRKELGQTILDAITATRMQRVKQLLAETDLSLNDIADRAGFSYVEYLSTSFRHHTGQSPSAYRRKFRRRPGQPP